MAEPLISVNIFPRHAQIEYLDKQASVIKNISIERLREVFNSQKVSTPLLPLWTIAYKDNDEYIRLISVREVGILEIPVGQGQSSMQKFHFPYIYFKWKIRKGTDNYAIVDSSIRTSFDYPNMNTNLYIPYINNVGPTGSICWGSNSTFINQEFSVNDFVHVKQAENIFYIGTHNYDLVQRERIEELESIVFETEDEWSTSRIIRSRNGVNLMQYIEEM